MPNRRCRLANSTIAASNASGPKSGQRIEVEVELGVRGLPDQEVREPLVATGPDNHVRIRHPGRVQRSGDGFLVDLLWSQAAGDELSGRVDKLGSARVVEGDVELQAPAAGRGVEGPLDRGPSLGRKLFDAAKKPYTGSLGLQLRRFVADDLLQQEEEAAHFLVGPGPVLPAEGIQGQDFDATPDGVADDLADGLDASRVAFHLRLAAGLRPAAVAVHDDRHVARQFVAGNDERFRRSRLGRRDDGCIRVDNPGLGVHERRGVRWAAYPAGH